MFYCDGYRVLHFLSNNPFSDSPQATQTRIVRITPLSSSSFHETESYLTLRPILCTSATVQANNPSTWFRNGKPRSRH